MVVCLRLMCCVSRLVMFVWLRFIVFLFRCGRVVCCCVGIWYSLVILLYWCVCIRKLCVFSRCWVWLVFLLWLLVSRVCMLLMRFMNCVCCCLCCCNLLMKGVCVWCCLLCCWVKMCRLLM